MKHKYIVAFIAGLCLMMLTHIASRNDGSWGGELLLPALTVSLVYLEDDFERWIDSKKRSDKDEL